MEDHEGLEKRPAIVVIGPQNVGKGTLISQLLKVDFVDDDDDSDRSIGLSIHGWMIDTKYYTADVSIWIIHLSAEFKIASLPVVDQVAALVMVFDVTDLTSFVALKEWVSHNDIQRFDILMCIGNKVDLLHGHPAHAEYKRRLMKHAEFSSNSYTEILDYGISESEGSNLLGDEEISWDDAKRSCLEWCLDHNIEYVEACASNPHFDKCLSVDGDSQGIERLYGALSAHMWPGMLLKSGDKINEPSLPKQEELSEEESDYEPQYEILSSGSAGPWDDIRWMSANDPIDSAFNGIQSEREFDNLDREMGPTSVEEENQPSTSASQLPEELAQQGTRTNNGTNQEIKETSDSDEDKTYDFEDLEKLMSEIGNVRNGLRLMPDFQRREMAAKLATKMAEMFGDVSDSEAGFD